LGVELEDECGVKYMEIGGEVDQVDELEVGTSGVGVSRDEDEHAYHWLGSALGW
jgi:hypothetical protein